MQSKHITPNLAGLLINSISSNVHEGFKLTATVEVSFKDDNIVAVSTVSYKDEILVGNQVIPIEDPKDSSRNPDNPKGMYNKSSLAERVVRAAMDSTQSLKPEQADPRLKTCRDCIELQANVLGNVTTYSCMRNDKIVPQHSERGKLLVFHRVPKWCTRPDTEVLKSPKGTEFNEVQVST